jgi:hypothetical protein
MGNTNWWLLTRNANSSTLFNAINLGIAYAANVRFHLEIMATPTGGLTVLVQTYAANGAITTVYNESPSSTGLPAAGIVLCRHMAVYTEVATAANIDLIRQELRSIPV